MLNSICTLMISLLLLSTALPADQHGNTAAERPQSRAMANQPVAVEAEIASGNGEAVSKPTGQNADEAVAADPVHAILHRLEASAADLNAFTADVYYETYDDLLGRREIRIGEIIYRITRPDDAARDMTSFSVLFDSLIVGQRRTDRQKHYVFHDRWLAEIDHETRQFIKRELVPPGRQLDPLKLGEGPIPLPIGQPKDEVLARFDVTLHELPDEGPLARLKNVDGLLLIPKPDTPEAQDYQRVELFYDRETNLPVGINAIEINDNRKTVRLSDVQRNPELSDEQLQKLSVEEPDPRRWSIDVRPFRAER